MALNYNILVNNHALAFSLSISFSLQSFVLLQSRADFPISLTRTYGAESSPKRVRCARFDPIHPPSASIMFPSLPLFVSLPRERFSVSLFSIHTELFTVCGKSRRNASNFPIVLLQKHYHNRLFSLKEKGFLSLSLFFSDDLCDICEKGRVLEIATGRGGLGERGKK